MSNRQVWNIQGTNPNGSMTAEEGNALMSRGGQDEETRVLSNHGINENADLVYMVLQYNVEVI